MLKVQLFILLLLPTLFDDACGHECVGVVACFTVGATVVDVYYSV